MSEHSIRSFLNKKVEAEKIQKILECSNQAPSAGNLKIYVIFMLAARYNERGEKLYTIQGATIA
ncbi:MAG: hypothetical protein A2X25_04215 [Chloroflexi bacterium GWB2_49_20]|nr:MAG: hypothetical protein A2X25_04215 [Chloroflexi bacterium GWB2_49_20]OGN77887.1 MAG: hypothetical protein A2X26_01995 [Chloroflexi bacterium GWC2_49_37]OGN82732.1 MAG: hypothetical protein A2X27_09035 [Chloroflexi bacterium GWD2_49_16]